MNPTTTLLAAEAAIEFLLARSQYDEALSNLSLAEGRVAEDCWPASAADLAHQRVLEAEARLRGKAETLRINLETL